MIDSALRGSEERKPIPLDYLPNTVENSREPEDFSHYSRSRNQDPKALLCESSETLKTDGSPSSHKPGGAESLGMTLIEIVLD